MMEAIETGAISISLGHSFLWAPQAMRGCPIVLLDRWADLPAWYAQTKAQPAEALDEQQRLMSQWWSDIKSMQQNRVSTLIEHCFATAGRA